MHRPFVILALLAALTLPTPAKTTATSYNGWAYLVSIKDLKDKQPKNPTEDGKNVFSKLKFGQSLQTAVFGSRLSYIVVPINQGVTGDPCFIPQLSPNVLMTIGVITANSNCTTNKNIESDPTIIDNLNYFSIVWVCPFANKLDLSKIQNKTQIFSISPKIDADVIALLIKTKFVQITADYPSSVKNNARLAWRYNLRTPGAKKSLDIINATMNQVSRNTHAQILPQLYTQAMITESATQQGQAPPACTFPQQYYSRPDCDKITDLQTEILIINEYVQQYCHNALDSQDFMKHMGNYFDQCIGTEADTQANPLKFFYCSKNLRESSKYAKDIKDCLARSFNGKYDSTLKPALLSNNLLESALGYTRSIYKNQGAGRAGFIYLNGALYTGEENSVDFTKLMCETYIKTPSNCAVDPLSWELIAILASVGLFFTVETICYFIFFARVVTGKTSVGYGFFF